MENSLEEHEGWGKEIFIYTTTFIEIRNNILRNINIQIKIYIAYKKIIKKASKFSFEGF
jgi:hypothetical protein